MIVLEMAAVAALTWHAVCALLNDGVDPLDKLGAVAVTVIVLATLERRRRKRR